MLDNAKGVIVGPVLLSAVCSESAQCVAEVVLLVMDGLLATSRYRLDAQAMRYSLLPSLLSGLRFQEAREG